MDLRTELSRFIFYGTISYGDLFHFNNRHSITSNAIMPEELEELGENFTLKVLNKWLLGLLSETENYKTSLLIQDFITRINEEKLGKSLGFDLLQEQKNRLEYESELSVRSAKGSKKYLHEVATHKSTAASLYKSITSRELQKNAEKAVSIEPKDSIIDDVCCIFKQYIKLLLDYKGTSDSVADYEGAFTDDDLVEKIKYNIKNVLVQIFKCKLATRLLPAYLT